MSPSPSKAEAYVASVLAAPSVDFFSPDGRVQVNARVGVSAQDGTTPILILTQMNWSTLQTETVALRNDNALALAAFIRDTFAPRGDDLTIAA